MKEHDLKRAVRKGYGDIAKGQGSCCGPSAASCCPPGAAGDISRQIGYSDEDLSSVPPGADLGLGCGNPVALASLKTGEVVLDLGSGSGFDCFLAAKKVGPKGRVIGVDMTAEMIEKARANAAQGGYENVDFRLGEIEHLPVPDGSADVIISNCVINLAPDKEQVFREAFRTLKPGGRLMISDLVLLKELPRPIKDSVEAYVGCLAGAIAKEDYLAAIERAGFRGVNVVEETAFPVELMLNDPTAGAILRDLKIPMEQVADIGQSVVSMKVAATRPR